MIHFALAVTFLSGGGGLQLLEGLPKDENEGFETEQSRFLSGGWDVALVGRVAKG